MLEQLSDQQRAIIELLVIRGRSYTSLAETLEMSLPVVRSLAHAALLELSPMSASRVAPELREQVADYLLGQQSAREARETRNQLRSSEPARTWALSIADRLAPLYGDGGPPEIPLDSAATAAPASASRTAAPERKAAPVRRAARAPKARRRPRPRVKLRRPRGRMALLAGALGALVVAAAIVLPLTLTGGPSHRKAAASNIRLVGVLPLSGVSGDKVQGNAAILIQNSQPRLAVAGKFPPTTAGYEYVLLLVNSPKDGVAIGATTTDAQGNLSGAGPLPANVARYKYLEVVLVKNGAKAQPVRIVAAGALANLRTSPQSSSSATP